MQGPSRCAFVTGLISALLGACDSDDTLPPDAPVGGSAGLVVAWSSAPSQWPGSLDGGLTIESARFAFDRLRVIGDAGPGDLRTTATGFELRWDASEAPQPIEFDEAPTGLYSQVSMQVDGHLVTETYEIRGAVEVEGQTYPFRIEDIAPLALTVEISEMLVPGTTVTVPLRVNFAHALDAVDWSLLDLDEGQLELDETDPQIVAFRANLVESFEIGAAGGGN